MDRYQLPDVLITPHDQLTLNRSLAYSETSTM